MVESESMPESIELFDLQRNRSKVIELSSV